MKDILASCRSTCWLIALITGAIVALYTAGFTDRSFFTSLILGALVAFFLGNIARWLFCEDGKPSTSTTALEAAGEPVAAARVAAPAAPLAAGAAEAVAETTADEIAAAEVVPDTKVDTTQEIETVVAADPVVEPETRQAASAADLGEDYDKDDVLEGVNEGVKPQMLSQPRGGQADDLKQIKGIGPKLEQLCFSLGFYHFDQIAGWTADEVAWVDANLKGFRGRVSRDSWVGQAKILAGGGDTEFSKRVEDGSVY